ncbi:hypothetical protein LXA43DRAFT_406253 [Ganoderma leucocontextum]|nr:hypothetical protein LXA43DRAFT_406253 [Ganoderma leucocontextum]
MFLALTPARYRAIATARCSQNSQLALCTESAKFARSTSSFRDCSEKPATVNVNFTTKGAHLHAQGTSRRSTATAKCKSYFDQRPASCGFHDTPRQCQRALRGFTPCLVGSEIATSTHSRSMYSASFRRRPQERNPNCAGDTLREGRRRAVRGHVPITPANAQRTYWLPVQQSKMFSTNLRALSRVHHNVYTCGPFRASSVSAQLKSAPLTTWRTNAGASQLPFLPSDLYRQVRAPSWGYKQ